MKSLPIAGAEWTVKLTRDIIVHAGLRREAQQRGWTVEQKAGEETHVLKLTLAGDHEAVMAASAGLREAWVADGWAVAHVGWKTRARLPKKETPPALPLADTAEAPESLVPGSTGKDEGGEYTVNPAGEKVYDLPERLRRKPGAAA